MEPTILIIVGLFFVLIVLSLAIASIASAYGLLFNKFEAYRKEVKKSGKGLAGGEKIIEEERQVLRNKMEQIVGQQSGEFQKVLSDVKAESLRLMTQIGAASKDEVRNDLADFRKLLSAKIDKELADTKAELDLYKAQKKKQIDIKANMVISEVVKKVIPDVIDLSKHEELITRALQKAKDEHFFEK